MIRASICSFLMCLFCSFVVFSDDKTVTDILAGHAAYKKPVDFANFQVPSEAPSFVGRQAGTLKLTAQLSDGFEVVADPSKIAKNSKFKLWDLPGFTFDFVVNSADIIPVRRGAIESNHPYFEWILEPGKVWKTPKGLVRFSLPVALMERGANCIHTGVLMGTLSASGSPEKAMLQIGSETCLYFKFNKWALLQSQWIEKPLPSSSTVVENYREEVANRLPVQPITELSSLHPALTEDALSQNTLIDPSDMTLFGAVVDGIHYVSDCDTRLGAYPHCDVLPLPSYSVAKSLVAGLGLLRLEKLYPEAMKAQVADYVPICAKANWLGVSFENLLDMTSGHYRSVEAREDENNHSLPFFLTNDVDEKLAFACKKFKRQTTPGKQWVYRTTDTFILSVAMQAFWQEKRGRDADYYRDLLVPLWRSLGLSPVIDLTRRTEGRASVPYAGYGLILHRSDAAKVAAELANPSDAFLSQFPRDELRAALQQEPNNSGFQAGSERLRYNNGFWGWNTKDFADCATDSWLPFMSGYGGISLVMMPEGAVYYYFSDSGKFPIAGPVALFANIKPICKEPS